MLLAKPVDHSLRSLVCPAQAGDQCLAHLETCHQSPEYNP